MDGCYFTKDLIAIYRLVLSSRVIKVEHLLTFCQHIKGNQAKGGQFAAADGHQIIIEPNAMIALLFTGADALTITAIRDQRAHAGPRADDIFAIQVSLIK